MAQKTLKFRMPEDVTGIMQLPGDDARTGKELWKRNLGGQIIAGPMSFATASGQKIAIAAGSGLFVFHLGTR